MIRLIGMGNLEESGSQPLHNWKEKSRRGNISFTFGRYIVIEDPGFYQIQTRVSLNF